MDSIIKRGMGKAKNQFGKRNPGILAICGYNQRTINMDILIHKLQIRLNRTERLNLAGIIIINQFVSYLINRERISFQPKINIEIIYNPSYFGRINLSISTRKEFSYVIKGIELNIIEKPELMSRVVIFSQNKNIFPFYKGKGNINFLCGKCKTLLAERVWKLSLNNIVVHCPSCQSYNEFPTLITPDIPIKGNVLLERHNYNFADSVIMKQGIILIGL